MMLNVNLVKMFDVGIGILESFEVRFDFTQLDLSDRHRVVFLMSIFRVKL